MRRAKGLLLRHGLPEVPGIDGARGSLGVDRVSGAAWRCLRWELLHWRMPHYPWLHPRRRLRRLWDLTRNTGMGQSLRVHGRRPHHPRPIRTHHDASAAGHGAETGLTGMRMICLSRAARIRLLLLLLESGMTRRLGEHLHRWMSVLHLLISGRRWRNGPLHDHLLLLLLHPLLHLLRIVWLLLLLIGEHLLLLLLDSMYRRVLLRG